MTLTSLAGAIALLSIAAGAVIGRLRPGGSAWIAATSLLAGCAAACFAWAFGDELITDLRWMSLTGSRLLLSLDPLAAPLVVFVMLVGATILYYSAGYMPEHLSHEGRSVTEQARFCALMLAFTAAMLLLLVAQDLLLIFVALELTAVVSYLLIKFDHDEHSTRAAWVAFLVTAGSSLFFLLGSLLIAQETGSTALPQIREWLRQNELSRTALVLIVAGVIAKSAQVPLHFWLPRAMVAPTPVSAYLHSATMVAAGVFVLQRLRFAFAGSPEILDLIFAIGCVSIAVGGVLALVADRLKEILAYSTIAQYGFVLVVISAGGDKAMAGAPFIIVAHGVCKCALFLTAGAVTSATGAERLSETGGLFRRMPGLAIASALAAAGLAGMPATVGYFKDEVLFAAALHRGTAAALIVTLGAAMTFAYTARFWLGVFAFDRHPAKNPLHPPRRTLTFPIFFLALVIALGGFWIEPLTGAFERAGEIVGAAPLSFELAYHFDLRSEVRMALGAWFAGIVVLLLCARWEERLGNLVKSAAKIAGPARSAGKLATAVRHASDLLHRIERRDPRDRIVIVLVAAAVLVILGVISSGHEFPPLRLPDREQIPLAAALLFTGFAAFAVTRAITHTALALLLSFVGFGLALSFALAGAPDVALILVIVETGLTLLYMALLAHLRPALIERARAGDATRDRRRWAGAFGGILIAFLAWLTLESPNLEFAERSYLKLAEKAHAHDVVTAILTDFRGFDTAGEITVLAVAVLGAAAISWGRRQ